MGFHAGMKSTRKLIGVLSLVVIGLVIPARGAAPDVSGTWKWEAGGRQGNTRAMTAKLKQDGTKVTGTIAGPQGREIEIQNGKISEDGTVAFATKVERGGRTIENKYQGKVSEDKLTGTTEFTTQNGQTRSREWSAKREGASLTGKWKTIRERDDGSTMEFIYNLKQEGNKLTGTTSFNNGEELPLKEGKVEGDKVTFKVVRERDGRSFTADYTGKLQGPTIVGSVAVDWGDGERSFDWEAKKVQ